MSPAVYGGGHCDVVRIVKHEMHLEAIFEQLRMKREIFPSSAIGFFLFGHVFIVYVTHQSSFPAEPPFVTKRQD